MSHKRVIKRRGKEYGPYVYESYRENGKVRKRYLGKLKEKKSFLVFILLGLLILVIGTFFLYRGENYSITEQIKSIFGGMSGLAVIDIEHDPLDIDFNGNLKIKINTGEILPEGTKIIVEQLNSSVEYNFSEFFTMNAEGNFYISGFSFNETGKGYGFAGEAIFYPEVYFILSLKDKESRDRGEGVEKTEKDKEDKNQTEKDKEDKNKTEEDKNQTEKDKEDKNKTEEDKNQTEKDKEKVTGKAVKEGDGIITGEAVLGANEARGVVSKGEPFEYNLEEGQTAKIKSGSIYTDYSDDIELLFLNFNVSGTKVVVSTDYNVTENGFGKEFLSDKEHFLEIGLEELGVVGGDGILNIKLVYREQVFASISKNIFNGSFFNLLINGSSNITTLQYRAVINRPVKWLKKIKVGEDRKAEIAIPKQAKNISVRIGNEVQDALNEIANYEKVIEEAGREDIASGIITGAVSLNIKKEKGFFLRFWDWITGQGVTGNVILEDELQEEITETDNEKIVDISSILEQTNEEDAAVEYYTLGPEAIEENLTNGKRIVITGPDEVHYENVLTYSELDNKIRINDSSKIRLYHYATKEETESRAVDVPNVVGENIIVGNETIETASNENASEVERANETALNESSSIITGQIVLEENGIISETAIVSEKQFIKEEVNFTAYDLDEDGNIDYIEWVVPYLSNQTYEIIYISKADVLDSDRNFLRDAYEYVKEKDGNWTTINSGEYLRVTFEHPLDRTRDITLYARNNGLIDVYEFNDTRAISQFNISEEGFYKVYLSNLSENENYTQDVFDLKFYGDVEIDYVVDPIFNISVSSGDLNNITIENNFSHLTISNQSPYDSLLTYFNFDDNVSITTEYDYNGLGDASYVIDVNTGWEMRNETNCVYGMCLWNDGIDQDNGLGFAGYDKNYTNFSISLWLKVDDHPAQRYALAIGNQLVAVTAGGIIFCTFVNTDGTQKYSAENVASENDGQWHHFVCNYNDTSGTIWKDGVMQTDVELNMGELHIDKGSNSINAILAQTKTTELNPFNGSIDEIMIFNTSLTPSQVSDIYNNVSGRFHATGKQGFSEGLNFSINNNKVTVTSDYQALIGSSLGLKVGYYDGSWGYTPEQVYTGNNVFNISTTATNVTLNFTFTAGAEAQPFYSPILLSKERNLSVDIRVNLKAYHIGGGVPTSPFNGSLTEASSQGYNNLSESDNTRWITALASADGEYDSQVFIFNISENRNKVVVLNVTWEGYGETQGSGYDTNISFWNWSSGSWKSIMNYTFTSANDVNLSASVSSTPADFINLTSNQVAVLVTTRKYVASAVCGNEIIEDGESCDPGADYGSCVTAAAGGACGTPCTSTQGCVHCVCASCAGYCGGGSPFLYTYQNNSFTKLSDFIPYATSKEKEYESYTALDKAEIQNGKLKLKITEELDETTYLDSYKLVVYDYPASKDFEFNLWLNENFEKINEYNYKKTGEVPDYVDVLEINSIEQDELTLYSDDNYLIMGQGFERELEFELPELEEGKNRKIFFAAEGYYIEHYKKAKEVHRSLYTDYISLTATIDTTSPILIIISPLNNSNYSTSTIEFNVSLNEAGSWCGFSLNHKANVTMTKFSDTLFNFTNSSMIQGSHNVTFSCNDTAGNMNTSLMNFFDVDLTAPALTIISPLNQSYSTSTIEFNVSLNEAGSWCGLSLDHSANVTMTKFNNTWFNFTNSSMQEGSHNITFSCNDTAGNMNTSLMNFFEVDFTAPALTIISPLNQSYSTTTIEFNVSLNEAGSWCSFSLNHEANVTMTKFNNTWFNFTNSSMTQGSHNVTFSCNDTAGNMNTSLMNFFDVVNIAPTNPTVSLVSVDGTNSTYSDLNCSSTIDDDDADKINVSVRWYNNSDLDFSLDYNNSYVNGSLFNASLESGNLTFNHNWTCSLRLYDGADYSDWVNSSSLQINGTGVTGCSVLDVAGTYYTQTANIVNNELTGPCINITADSVVYDCAGYSITSDDNVAGIYSNSQNTTIKNCNVDVGANGYGIQLDSSASYSKIINNTLNNQYGGLYLNSAGLVNVTNNTANSNFEGFFLVSGPSVIFTNNTANSNSYGFYISSTSSISLNNNSAGSNTIDGIAFISSSYNRVTGGTMSSNTNYGVNIDSDSTGNNVSIAGSGNTADVYTAGNNSYVNGSLSSTSGIEMAGAGNTLKLSGNLIPGRTGINITAGNAVVDCQGYSIINASLEGTGIYSNQAGSIIQNCTINLNNSILAGATTKQIFLKGALYAKILRNNLNGQYGVYLDNANSSRFEHNILNSNSEAGVYSSGGNYNNFTNNTANLNRNYGLYFVNSDNNLLSNNTANDNNNNYGIYFSSSDYNKMANLTGNSNNFGVYLDSSSSNNVSESSFSSSGASDVSVFTSSINNMFLNASYNTESVQAGSQLIRKWHYKAYVNDTAGNIVRNANITFYNRTSNYQFNLTTGSDGWTNISEIIDYVNNGTTFYYSNYNVTARNLTYDYAPSRNYNVTSNQNNLSVFFSLTKKPTITLSSPLNNLTTTNRSLEFSWSGSDPESDSLTYEINITCWELGSVVTAGSVYKDKSVIGSSTTYTPALGDYLKCLSDNAQYYNWSVRAWDGFIFGDWVADRNLSIQSDVTANLDIDDMNFGEMNVSDTDNTIDGSPSPFVIRNEGNAEVNVSLVFTDLWSSATNPSDYLKYKIRNHVAGDCYVTSGTLESWTQAPSVSTASIERLNFTSGFQTGCSNASTDMYILVPADEISGNKTANATFTSSLAEKVT